MTRLAASVLAILVSLSGVTRAATSLDELLEQTKTARAREAEEDRKREEEFKASRDSQAKLLAGALAERAALETKSSAHANEYDANEKALAELGARLREREGGLGELFGVTRQVAGDTANVLSQSLISAELPEREAFLRTLASAKALPSIAELEGLWFELQREMTESGKVARARLPVVLADGATREAEVVRVGPFTATSEGRYLAYLPGIRRFSVLPRAPSGSLERTARALEATQSGYARAAVDPSRGVLLALYVERPSVWERVQRGHLVGYVILAVGLAGALCAAVQLVYLLRVRRAVGAQLESLDRPSDSNPLGRVLLAWRGNAREVEERAEIAELRISEAVLREVPKLERFQSFLRLAVAAGPLLGLIGTVIGMILTFQSITESGSSDPKLMADGIGQAMIATVLGLGIAIPLLFANAVLGSLSRGVVQTLDEQSTGLLAESLERTHAA